MINEHFGLPVLLRSKFLLNTIYRVDDHISKLEELVQEQDGELKLLRKQASDRLTQDVREKEAKVWSMLSQVMSYREGAPPINQDMGLDAVLILKHLEGLIHQVKEEGIRQNEMQYDEFFDDVEQYVNQCMQKAKRLPTGESNEQAEG